jgi:hypothetical protein
MREKLKRLADKLKLGGVLRRLRGMSRRTTVALFFVLLFAGIGAYTLWPTHAEGLSNSPAVASWGAGRLDVFALGNDHAVWHKWYQGGWSGWESLGGYCNSEPAAKSWGYGRIDIFCKAGANNNLYHKWFDGGWSGWENLGGNLISGPAVTSWGPGHLDVFAVGTDHAVWHKWFINSWSGWGSLGGYVISTPAAVSWSYGRIDIAAVGSNNAMYHKWFDGSWDHPWENLGGAFISGPSIASWGAGHLDIFGTGTDHAMWHKYFGYGYGWSGWSSLGGYVTSSPAAVAWGVNRIDTFVRSSDNNIYHKAFDPSVCSTGWCTSWDNQGGNSLPPPIPTAPAPTPPPTPSLAPPPGPPSANAKGNVVGCTKSDPYRGCVGSWWYAHGGPDVYDFTTGAKLSGYVYVDDTTPCGQGGNPNNPYPEPYPMSTLDAQYGSQQCVQLWVNYFRTQNPNATIYAALQPGTSVSTKISGANATLIEWYPASGSGQSTTAKCGAGGYILQRYYVGGSVSTTNSTQWSGFPALWTSAENCLLSTPNTILSYY